MIRMNDTGSVLAPRGAVRFPEEGASRLPAGTPERRLWTRTPVVAAAAFLIGLGIGGVVDAPAPADPVPAHSVSSP
ncbi:MAG TPA: hypothetical protein VHF92_05420 [Geodermatophilus sp.]|nr:hypothetical protein [Geodermatophilus sp.]